MTVFLVVDHLTYETLQNRIDFKRLRFVIAYKIRELTSEMVIKVLFPSKYVSKRQHVNYHTLRRIEVLICW